MPAPNLSNPARAGCDAHPRLHRRRPVTVEETIDAFTVDLGQNESGEGVYLILQCALTPLTGRDAATGMDTHCLTDELGAVLYGGMEHAELRGETLRLRFDQSAADELAVPGPERTLNLTVPSGDAARLADGLRRVLTYGNPDHRPDLTGI